jgi:hypothetical protein
MKIQLEEFTSVWPIVAGFFTMLGCTATFETSTDITAAPFELTSSTSGKAPYPQGPHVQAKRFITHNFENIKQDMAQGGGEYIDSLGTVLGIPGQGLSQFAASMQASQLMTETMTPQGMWEVLRREDRTWPMSARGYAR